MYFVFKNGYFYNLMIFMNFYTLFSSFCKLIIYLSTNFNVKLMPKILLSLISEKREMSNYFATDSKKVY